MTTTNNEINNIVEALEKEGFCYTDNEDGTYDVCFDHAQDSWYGKSAYHVASVREDADMWYVDCQTGLGEGGYPKTDYTLLEAIEDQCLDE